MDTPLIVTRVPAPGRSCAGCTLCCKLPSLHLDGGHTKPLNVWCEHCDPTTGCRIYEDRWQACRDFMCQWLCDPGMPEAMTPRRTRCVVKVDPGNDGLSPVVRVHEAVIGAAANVESLMYASWVGGASVIVFTPDNWVKALAWDLRRNTHTIISVKADPTSQQHPVPLVTFDVLMNEYRGNIKEIQDIARRQAQSQGLEIR